MESPLQPAVDLIKHWEGCVLHSYQDSVGVWTIGYGTTHGVHPGMVITKEQAIQFMQADMEKCVNAIHGFVHVPLANNELCALISLSYNIGIDGLKNSTLIRKLNAGHPRHEVADEFMKWVHGGGRVIHGLVNRRREERALFLSAHPVMELA